MESALCPIHPGAVCRDEWEIINSPTALKSPGAPGPGSPETGLGLWDGDPSPAAAEGPGRVPTTYCALCQGTTLVVPFAHSNEPGFSP